MHSTHFQHKTKLSVAKSLITTIKKNGEYEKNFLRMLEVLETDKNIRRDLCEALEKLYSNKEYLRLLTEKGISTHEGFRKQLKNYFIFKVLPEYEDPRQASLILQTLFPHAKDYIWVEAIPESAWSRLFSILFEKEIYKFSNRNPFLWQILNAIQILSVRINSLGLEQDIIDKLPELERFESPFMALNREVIYYIEKYKEDTFNRSTENQDLKQILVLLEQCQDYLNMIRNKKGIFGVSLNLTNYMVRLADTMRRFRLLLNLITIPEDNILFREEINLFKGVIKAHCAQKSLRLLIARHMGLLTNQITQRISVVGENYVTMNWSEYFVMLISSSKAGLIVGALSVLKILITGIGLPLFGSAFFYSMNYSMGFIAIQLANGKLATKQPAMTASHLAHAIDQTNLNKNSDHQMISELVVHILRSQFIAFVGNIFIALPSAVLFSWIYERLTGSPLVDSKKALYLIAEVDPIYSASLYYAAIAGVFLFFSGLIVGYYDNLCVVGNIPARIKRHPLLRRILPAWVLVRVSNYLDNNLGTLAGNFYLGIFLGCTGTLGIFLGLPLEIRHITFSAANMGLAAYGLNFNLTQQQIVTSTIGVLGIGVVNLIVSFGLSTIMAVESRKMSFSMYKRISKGMLIYILKNPLKLLVPIKSEGARISVEN